MNGNAHHIATLTGAVTVPAFMYFAGFPAPETIGMIGGFLVTLFVNPDLDLSRQFPRRQPHKWPWWLLWWPYMKIFPHRHPLSHAPIVSTLIRVGYILGILVFLASTLQFGIAGSTAWIPFVIFGMIISDCIHYIMDYIPKRGKD